MNDIQTIITERVDDIPLLLEQMQRMELATLIDHHFPAHGNWHGLSLGWVSSIWLRSILSRGEHRLSHVEPWVANRCWTRETVTDQDVERLDFTDDRLEIEESDETTILITYFDYKIDLIMKLKDKDTLCCTFLGP